MNDILVAAHHPTDPDETCWVAVPGAPCDSLPGVWLTETIEATEPDAPRRGVLTHAATGRRIGREWETLLLAGQHILRLSAVSEVFGIDWTREVPVGRRERDRAAKVAAVKWALDPVAKMFNAPCPRAIEQVMMSGRAGEIDEATIGVLVGA